MSRLLPSQTSTAMMLAQSRRSIKIPLRSTISSARLFHQSSFLQDKPSASAPSSRPQQNKPRRAFFWQRRDRKETRNRLSTLALDPHAANEAETQEAAYGSRQKQQSGSKDETTNRKSRNRLMSRNQRNILLFTVVLSIPIIGKDVMEVVVPGLLGTIIFVGSKIKSGIKWLRRIGSGTGS